MAVAKSVGTYHAPGRVNLIGEHTDYNGGFVLPAAIALGCTIRVSPAPAGELVLKSKQMPDTLDGGDRRPARRAAAQALERLRRRRGEGAGGAGDSDRGGDGSTIDATVPTGSGLSSSAALEVGTAYALLAGRPMAELEIRSLASEAERNFVGMPCGIIGPVRLGLRRGASRDSARLPQLTPDWCRSRTAWSWSRSTRWWKH